MGLPFKQILLGALLLLALVGLMGMAAGDAKADSPFFSDDVDLFLNLSALTPVDGVRLLHVEGKSSEDAKIKAEIALFNGGSDEATIPAGVRILTFKHKNQPLKLTPNNPVRIVDVVLETPLKVPGRSEDYPGFVIVPVYFGQEFLDPGLNEWSYTVDPDNKVAEINYPAFEWYQKQLYTYPGSAGERGSGDYGGRVETSLLRSDTSGNTFNVSEKKYVEWLEKEGLKDLVTCTILASTTAPISLLSPHSQITIGCENGMTGNITNFGSLTGHGEKGKYIKCPYHDQNMTDGGIPKGPCEVGATIKLESGFTVGTDGEIVLVDLMANRKIWAPGYYIFGEYNNQTDMAPGLKYNHLNPESWPLNPVRVRPVCDPTAEYEEKVIAESDGTVTTVLIGYEECLPTAHNTFKFYHPDSYPDLVITNVRVEPEKLYGYWGEKYQGEYTLVVEGVNNGGDLVGGVDMGDEVLAGGVRAWTRYDTALKGTLQNETVVYPEPVKSGEQFEFRTEMSNHPIGTDGIITYQIIIADYYVNLTESASATYRWRTNNAILNAEHPHWQTHIHTKGHVVDGTNWAAFLNASFPADHSRAYWKKSDEYALPREKGSENHPIPLDHFDSPEALDPDLELPHGNMAQVVVSFTQPSPSVIYPDDGHVWKQGIYPPPHDKRYQGLPDLLAGSLSSGTEKINFERSVATDCYIKSAPKDRKIKGYTRSVEQWSYDCFGAAYAPIWGINGMNLTILTAKDFKATEKWLKEWPKSAIKFRWLPNTKQKEFTVQVHNVIGKLIHETTFQLTPLPDQLMDIGTGIKDTELNEEWNYNAVIQQYYSENKLTNQNLFNQWLYDGPPLEAGEYTFRVAYADNWSEKTKFFIESQGMLPSDSTRPRDTNLSSEIRLHGIITGVRPDGFTLTTDSGWSVHLNTNSDTIIWSEATGIRGELTPGWKVEVVVPEVPYIAERAYVPLNQIPVAKSIKDVIIPELIYPTEGQILELGIYPPIQDDWDLCSSQKCAPNNMLSTPSLEPWKAGWIDSLLRFRWLPTLTTENARFKLEIQNDSGSVIYESDFVPGLLEEGLNSTSTGIAIDETTWLGDAPSLAQHFHQIKDHYLIDRRISENPLWKSRLPFKTAFEIASLGKFYQYVYDGPILMPGEYTWKIALIPEAVSDPEVWSPKSTFIVKAGQADLESPDQLEQSSGKDKVVFKGKVTKTTPVGFIVATESGSVHVRTDSDTKIFSPLTQFHDEVPLDWKVIVLGEVEPYILDRPYTPDDGNVFSGQITDIRPGGFSVGTQSGLVHMQSDANTVIHSAETGLHDEVPVGWNVHFISQVAPYLSERAYVPNVQIPIASNVIEQMPTATDVTEHVSNRTHKRCTALGATDAGTTAFSCDDGDYVELNATDIPNGTSAVVLVQHNPKTVNCTVVSNPSDTQSILQCEDGNNKIIENYLAVGTVIQSQNDAAKLVSTAGALYSRMEQFKLQATAINDSSLVAKLSSYQDEANIGFKEAYQQAMANAAPQVLALMEMMGTLTNKVSALAQAFVSGEGQLIFDDHNIQELAAQLRQFAGNYDSIIDIMVIETLADLPQQIQDKAKADIKNVSTQFLSNMKSVLEQTAQLLEQGNIPDALTLLDKITSDEEVWMQQTVQPYLNIVLAQQAIDDAKKDLSRYNDMLSETAKNKMLSEAAKKIVLSRKEDLQSRINDLNGNLLKELQQPGTVDLMPYIESLWNETALPWDEDAMDEAYLLELEDLIKYAKTALVDYADDMEQAVKDEINAKILILRGAIDDEDEKLIQAASDDLAGALASSGSGSELEEGSLENIVKKAQELIAHAEIELVDYADDMEQAVKDEIEAKKLTLSQILGSKNPSLIQDAVDVLLTALAKYKSTSEEKPEGGLATKIINQTLSVADGIIENSKNKIEPDLLNNLKQRTDLLRTTVAGDDEDLIKNAFNDLTVLLEELKNYAPDIQVGVIIECAEQVLVGKVFECSSKHTVLPDQVTWSTPGGAPVSGTGETFQTMFSTVGQFSISIKACVGEDCVTDVQTVTVVEELPSDKPSEEEQPEAQLSIIIECAAQVFVGKAFECSFKHTMLPDQVTWSAPGGTPASGTDKTFQTTFSTVGQFSISIKACVSSDCVADSQSITVIEDNPQEKPSDDQSSEGHSSSED